MEVNAEEVAIFLIVKDDGNRPGSNGIGAINIRLATKRLLRAKQKAVHRKLAM
jgi:hypothetical protein